jgi:hypothetical protein
MSILLSFLKTLSWNSRLTSFLLYYWFIFEWKARNLEFISTIVTLLFVEVDYCACAIWQICLIMSWPRWGLLPSACQSFVCQLKVAAYQVSHCRSKLHWPLETRLWHILKYVSPLPALLSCCVVLSEPQRANSHIQDRFTRVDGVISIWIALWNHVSFTREGVCWDRVSFNLSVIKNIDNIAAVNNE